MERRPTALVTGGARGIGRGICTALAREGFDIVFCDVLEEADVTGVVRELEDSGTGVAYVRADISRRDDREHLIEEVRTKIGALNLLVNNAGVAPTVRTDILEATEESFDRLVSINLKGPYFLSCLAARYMIEQKRADPAFAGSIQFISSIRAVVAGVDHGDYCITKAGISMAAKLFAVRLAEYGIACYEIRPGIIRTDMTRGAREKYDKLFAEGLALEPRWGTAEDIGRCSAMLARGDLPYATGQVLVLDGGLTVQSL